jgi:hypothetical protein
VAGGLLAVRTSLNARIDATGILPPNIFSAIVGRICSDPITRERLHNVAQGVMDHLLSDKPGWGKWPSDVGEAYKITPAVISITDTGLGKCSILENIEAVLRKVEHWHQGSIAKLQIMCRDGKEFWHRVRWDDETASVSALQETDERETHRKLLGQT